MNRDVEDGLRQAETAFMELCAMATGDLEKEPFRSHKSKAFNRMLDGLQLVHSARKG